MILAGIDEAGYGPTLGPLVVAATAFRVVDDRLDEGDSIPDLWKLLRRSVSRKPSRLRIAVEDSKKLYAAPRGLGRLEEGGLVFLQAADGGVPGDFRALLARLIGRPEGHGYLDLYPWYRGRNLNLPVATYPNFIRRASEKLRADLAAAGLALAGMRAATMEVIEFNRQLERLRNKARVSFIAVGALLRRLWSSFPAERIEAMVDRQGGRMRYGPLLYRRLRPRGLRVLEETDTISRYELLRDGPSMRVTFQVDCESRCLPVALSSMICKYVRELHMSIFNKFWMERAGALGIRSTAGYHLDARRFLEEIAPLRRELGVDDAALIRRR